MLSSRAFSFRRKCRLAISLSWIGGYVNLLTFLACGSYVANVTGNITFIGRLTIDKEHARALFFAFGAAAFFVGTLISAVLLEFGKRRGDPSKYVRPIAVEATLLLVFAIGFELHGPAEDDQLTLWRYFMVALAAIAMGIQNATMTNLSGSVVRTTHVTGVVTDIGLESVQVAAWWWDQVRGNGAPGVARALKNSRRHPPAQRLFLLSSILASFIFGAVFGAWLFTKAPAIAALPPILFLAFIIYVDVRKPIADMRKLDPMEDPELRVLGLVKATLPASIGIYRLSCGNGDRRHRPPDFQLWVDRVSPRLRVVILAIDPRLNFDANTVLDLETALTRLHNEGRKLIISGVTAAQNQALRERSVERMMDVANICPDLDTAIVRAVAAWRRLEADAAAKVAPGSENTTMETLVFPLVEQARGREDPS